MIDRGEGNFLERLKSFFNKFNGKGFIISQIFVIILIALVIFQNGSISSLLNRQFNEAEGNFHEIYDNTKVIAAYRTGDESKLDSKDLFVLKKLKEVVSAEINDEMTPYDMEKAIYDWQVGWVNYSQGDLNPITPGSSESHTPYGVLSSHNAICVGNATTFKLFMDALEIPCMIIHSTERGEHAWNIVKLDDEWYHVDITFDGGTQGDIGYRYFNVPDSMKDDGAWPWDHNKIPEATGVKYCYMLKEAENLENLYDIPIALKNAKDSKKTSYTFTLKDRRDFTQAVAQYIAELLNDDQGGCYFDNVYSLDGKIVYRYTIERWGESSDQVPEDIMARINEILYSLDVYQDDGEFENAVG